MKNPSLQDFIYVCTDIRSSALVAVCIANKKGLRQSAECFSATLRALKNYSNNIKKNFRC